MKTKVYHITEEKRLKARREPGCSDDREVRRITVRRMAAYLYTSMYLSFGWELEQTTVPVSRPIYTELCFSRKDNIHDPAAALSLWRQFDAAVGEIEAQERIQTGCTRKAVLFGFAGVAMLAAAFLISHLAAPAFLPALLLWLGMGICASAFFFYCAIYKCRADEFAENLCENYQKIYTLCQQAAGLLTAKA